MVRRMIKTSNFRSDYISNVDKKKSYLSSLNKEKHQKVASANMYVKKCGKRLKQKKWTIPTHQPRLKIKLNLSILNY